jgi:hypothetical protein
MILRNGDDRSRTAFVAWPSLFATFFVLLCIRRSIEQSSALGRYAGMPCHRLCTDISTGRAPCNRGIIPQLPLVL